MTYKFKYFAQRCEFFQDHSVLCLALSPSQSSRYLNKVHTVLEQNIGAIYIFKNCLFAGELCQGKLPLVIFNMEQLFTK